MKKCLIALVISVALILSGCVFGNSWEQLFGQVMSERAVSENAYTTIADMLELRDYVIQQRKNGKTEFSFMYSGTEEIDPGMIAQMGDACYVKMIQEGNVYHLELTLFPGERIVNAYLNGETESLSKSEKQALQVAREMVETAKSQTDDNWELERLLHDMLCERISYSYADIYYEKPEDQPPHLSVLGALLDGEANCQGYTDAFYTVASIAGFEVGRLSVETDTAPHMVNTIYLEGNWYVVDVTYDDSNEDYPSYRLFNAGRDMIGHEYTWQAETKQQKIIANSDEMNYYIRNQLVFDSFDDLAEFVIHGWDADAGSIFYAMVKNESDSEAFNTVLADALDKMERAYSYSLIHSSNGFDSFYTVIFDEKEEKNMKIKLLFQGDSITDAGRSREDAHMLGNGYVKYAAAYLQEAYPQVDFEFINLGISGDQTKDLVARLETDFVEIQPDIVSILIGINDVWHHASDRSWIPNDVFEQRYRTVLQAIKENTSAKIMMLEPFLIPVEDKQFFREDLYQKIEIERKLAREYADVYVPTDGLLASAYIGEEPTSYAADGVHPTDKGAEFIGRLYCEYMKKIIDKMV